MHLTPFSSVSSPVSPKLYPIQTRSRNGPSVMIRDDRDVLWESQNMHTTRRHREDERANGTCENQYQNMMSEVQSISTPRPCYSENITHIRRRRCPLEIMQATARRQAGSATAVNTTRNQGGGARESRRSVTERILHSVKSDINKRLVKSPFTVILPSFLSS